MTYVIFWDIDGTLLSTARAGVFALEDAAREVLGRELDFTELQTAGLTDAEIAATVIESLGDEVSDDTVNSFLRSYERHLPEALPKRDGRVLPNVEAVLDSLSARDDVHQLLLTGNTPAGAEAKLRHYGLWERLPGHGGLCSLRQDRDTIAREAWELAKEHLGSEPVGEKAFVIGDTEHDIRVGKAIGARTVAVATGPPSLEDLRSFEPWLLLESLPEPAGFVEALGLHPAQ